MRLRTDQKTIAEALKVCPTVVLAMGRRWGKTVLGYVLVSSFAAYGGKAAWVVPTYKNGRPLWRMLRDAVAEHRTAGLARVSETERTVEFAREAGGGLIAMYTGEDDCDAMRGEDFDLVVVDEAARLSEIAWTDAVLPTLADRAGRALLISTPRGRNWFWRWWTEGQDPAQADEVRSFTAPSGDNPNPRIRHAAEMARLRVSERTYRQEWLAEFVEDGGGVFRNVRACVAGALEPNPAFRGRYAIGVDLAKKEDFTVQVVMDLQERRVVGFDRFNKADWPLVKARIATLAHRWNDALVWMDSTGVGDPIYDDLRRVQPQIRVQPYQFTAGTKAALIENAVLQVENRQVSYPAVPELLRELEAYEYVTLPSGHMRMTAPEGTHDDCVIAFALACWPLAHQSAGIPRSALELLTAGVSRQTGIGGAGIMGRSF